MASKRRPYLKVPVEDRFWDKVSKDESGCWLWLAYIGPQGYGRFYDGTRSVQAHRFAYKLLIGAIPDGLDLDHLCRVRHCVNPKHLEPVTRAENLRRGIRHGPVDGGAAAAYQRSKDRCPQGHLYSDENTYSPPSRPTARYCRACHLLHTWKRRGKIAEVACASI